MKKLLAAMFCIVVLLSSCQDELCYNHNHAVPVRLHFSFSPAPEENPTQMNVYFFPSTGAAPLMYQTSGSGVETILLPVGKYRVMCLNSDTETISYHDTDSWDSFYVTARSESVAQNTRTKASEDLLMQPEDLFIGTIPTDTELVDIEAGHDLILPTNNVVYTYNFTIEGVKNLKYVSSLSGYISGLTSGYKPCSGEAYEVPCTHSFEASYDEAKGDVYISMMTFGRILDENLGGTAEPSELILNVSLVDGSVWEYDFNVSKQLDEAQPDLHQTINIVIEDIPIPEPVNPGNSTFSPDVDGWGEGEDFDVPM